MKIVKCKWCGREFKRKHNRSIYCSHDCRHYAQLEQKAQHIRKKRLYYKKYHIQTFDSYKNSLGTPPVNIKEIKKYRPSL